MANNAENHMEKPVLLLTRPRESAQRFLSRLDQGVLANARVVTSPLIEIVPTGAPTSLAGHSGAIFTSAHAPPLVLQGEGKSAFCVGQRTARAAQAQGWNVKCIAETAEDLIPMMSGVRGPLVHFAGTHRRGEISERLTDAGVETDVKVVYDQPAQKLSDVALHLLQTDAPIVVPFFSPRSAEIFVRQAQAVENIYIIAMSSAVAEKFDTFLPKDLKISPTPTREDMLCCVEKLLAGLTLP
jgi:uroporphyrinogen-III synthase